MKKVGTRILYNDVGVVFVLHRMEGDVLDRDNSDIRFIDIPFDDFDPHTHFIKGVVDDKPIIEKIQLPETPEQKRIRELEDVLLLQAEAELGGIL